MYIYICICTDTSLSLSLYVYIYIHMYVHKLRVSNDLVKRKGGHIVLHPEPSDSRWLQSHVEMRIPLTSNSRISRNEWVEARGRSGRIRKASNVEAYRH